ncbi:MAG TPA: ATP-binding protein [Anaerolineales bacterium]|nr:ATP-binding protein [Anaerolineales bacterium]
MSFANYRKRLDALFANLERLSANPLADAAAFRRDLEELWARMRKLEEDLAKADQSASRKDAPSTLPAPGLYEIERVGYAYDQDSIRSLQDSESQTFAHLDGIQAPLVAGGETIGKMVVRPPSERQWTTEELSLLNAVAKQASLQIENLRLLEAAQRARAEAEAATRRFIHERWDAFLDAIHQSERVGFAYDQSKVMPFAGQPPPGEAIGESVKMLDEEIGTVFVKPNPSRPLTEEEKAMVRAVAQQVAQQVENLRLLADASRARAEAEEATRRLTHQAWQEYAARKDGDFTTLGFAYDSNQVLPLDALPPPQDITLSQPLVVRGEPIGQLAVANWHNVTPEAAELATTIAERVSAHLEIVRLTEELQKRAYELQELDRLKSAFLANMSHELRTPLNSILGFTDVMLEGLDGPLTETMINDLKLIQKNGQHLLHLINDILDMAKIEAGRMNLTLETFALTDLFEEVVNLTSSLASERNNALFIEADSDRGIEIHADRTRLRQVMLNLINNAIKFTERGKISIRAERRDQTALITVRDTGIGIPPEKLEEIFKEFTQVDTSTTRKVGGTGLGLPISRKLVEMHGGRLWAESTGIAGEGSTFFVELPLKAVIVETEKA